MIQLIEQFYLPDKGCLLYNGVPMTEFNVAWLRSQLSLVAQEADMFDISVKENIRFGLANATEEDIEKAAKEANCHDFITSFPDGYDTILGSAASTQVSRGQKQHIALARALLRNPKILLLDKATSALDYDSEQFFQSTIDKITANNNCAIVQIPHKISTVQNSDRIVVLNNGKVEESGTHNQLMALKSHYHRLVGLRKEYTEPLNSLQILDIPSSLTIGRSETEALRQKSNTREARSLAKRDWHYLLIGGIGASLTGRKFASFPTLLWH